MRDQMLQSFHERLIRDTEIIVAAPRDYERAVCVCVLGELADQTGLADPRLAGHERRPPT